MRKFIIAGGILVLALVFLAVALPFLIPASTYEAKVIAAVRQATGRDLKIDGPVSLSILKGFSLEAEKVSLANASGAPDRAMATLAKLEIGLKLLPLLSGDVEITRLVLTSPVIHLDVDKAGRGNWIFEPAAPAPAPAEAGNQQNARAASRLKELHFGEVKIVDGTLTYADARTGRHEEMTRVDAAVKLASLDQPLDLSGSAVWHKQAVEMTLKMDKPAAMMAGAVSNVSVKLSSAPLKLDFAGDLATKPAVKANGTLSLSGPSLRDAALWAGSPMKAGGPGLGPFSLQGKVALAGNAATLSGLSFSLDQIKGGGEITADLSGKIPSIKGGISLGALDLNPYLAQRTSVAPAVAPVAAPVTPGSGWSEAPIDLAALRTLDVQLALTLASLRFEKIEIGKSVVAVLLQNGKLVMAFRQIELYGGSGTGQIVVNGATPVTGLNAEMALSNIQIQPVLEAVMGVGRLSGTGKVNLAIAAHGRSQHDLIATLAGQGAMQVANGALKGVDFAALAKDIAAVTAKDSTGSDQTTFSTLGGTFTISNGVLSNSDLSITSPLFHLTGQGTASLLNRTLNFRIEPNLAGSLQGGKSGILGTTVPIIVEGPWDHLTYRPDLQAVLQQKLAKKLPAAVNKLLGRKAGSPDAGSSKPADILKSFLGR